MRIAFYAPMKAPDHPVPSGDRAIARALVRALRIAGHGVQIASRLRAFDASGERALQARHRAQGAREAQRLLAKFAADARPDLWFTYHLHHKAPDCIGPLVARTLCIPYVVAEASVAPRQAHGPWASGHALAHDAIAGADAIVFLNPADVAEVERVIAPQTRTILLAPFIEVAESPGGAPAQRSDADRVRLITVAMMREGAKLASYRVLAAALPRLRDTSFDLVVVGDGPARAAVESLFAPIAERVAFIGALPPHDVVAQLGASDVFVWPAIDEAIGIAFLEAQASGLPVVAGASPGVASVVAHGRSGVLTPPGDVEAFAAAVRELVIDAGRRRTMGARARAYVRQQHDIHAASARLDALLREAVSSAVSRARSPLRPALSAAFP
jgi:glycosyltransferase involved in cell wall biosynthesis